MAEFTFNNRENASTNMSSFFLRTGSHPLVPGHPVTTVAEKNDFNVQSVKNFVEHDGIILEKPRSSVALVQQT